jgi:hypothetical protein
MFYRRRYRSVVPPTSYDNNVKDETLPSRFENLLKKPIEESEQIVIKSFQSFYSDKKYLTYKQFKYFEVIEKQYDDEKIRENEEFQVSFKNSKEMQENDTELKSGLQ